MAIKELWIKLLIDSKAHKVCFAEADSDVIEFLSSLLCLPVSTVISLLTNERMVGSIGNVLDSVEKLGAKFVISSTSKEPYLRPTVAPTALCPLEQLLDAPLNANTSFFRCEGNTRNINCGYFSAIKGSICHGCFKTMDKEVKHMTTNGFTVNTTTYTVTDDLSITPSSSVSTITLLAQFGVKDLSALQHRSVKIGKEEALEILLASLKSKTVLTDVFLPKKKVRCKKETA
ncbi:hypothetical protein ACP4OV_022295 [Aristida adscensionis]